MAQVATDIPRPHQVAGEQSAPTGARGGRPRWAALAWGVAGLVVVLASIIGGVLVGPAQISVAQVLQVFATESGVGEGSLGWRCPDWNTQWCGICASLGSLPQVSWEPGWQSVASSCSH